MWLSPEVWEWNPWEFQVDPDERPAPQRAYSHLGHAERLLNEKGDEHYRASSIKATKQALDVRLNEISSTFYLDSLDGRAPRRRRLDRLEELGVIRPFLLRELLRIRNDVEHADIAPPEEDVCQAFADIVWYFLRTTDVLFFRETSSFVLVPRDDHPGDATHTLEVRTGPPNWSVEVDGWVSPSLIEGTVQAQWIALSNAVVDRVDARSQADRRRQWEETIRREPWRQLVRPPGERSPFDLHLEARVDDPSTIRRFAAMYFEAKWRPHGV